MATPSPEHARPDRGRIANDACRTRRRRLQVLPAYPFAKAGLLRNRLPASLSAMPLPAFAFRPRAPAQPEEMFTRHLGDDVIITTVGSGQRLTPVSERFVVCDYFKSEMSEYDANYVFVQLQHLQHLLTMEDRATSIQIKLKDYDDSKAVVAALKQMFPGAASSSRPGKTNRARC